MFEKPKEPLLCRLLGHVWTDWKNEDEPVQSFRRCKCCGWWDYTDHEKMPPNEKDLIWE